MYACTVTLLEVNANLGLVFHDLILRLDDKHSLDV